MKDTHYGLTASRQQRLALDDAYRGMAAEYARQIFSDLGWDVGRMEFFVDPDEEFQVEYWPDTAEEWKRYPGKWQTWEEWPG